MAILIYDNLPFPESDLASTPSNRALGRFFTAWGQVEGAYGMIFRELCRMEHDVGTIVFEKIGVREQLDILDDMVELISDDDLRGVLAISFITVRNISVARNKIGDLSTCSGHLRDAGHKRLAWKQASELQNCVRKTINIYSNA